MSNALDAILMHHFGTPLQIRHPKYQIGCQKSDASKALILDDLCHRNQTFPHGIFVHFTLI